MAIAAVAGIVVKKSSPEKSEVVYEETDEPIEVYEDEPIEEYEESWEESEAEEEYIQEEVVEGEYVHPDFAVKASNIEDYGNNLDISLYTWYDSGYYDFCFSYPAGLYNDVEVNNDEYETEYGLNLQSIHFYGSQGSELVYRLIRRTDTVSIEEMTDYVYNCENSWLYETETIVNSTTEEHGKVIIIGYGDSQRSSAVYNMTKIEDDCVLQMIVSYPQYTSEEDRNEKCYVVECLYRLCGFSDSTFYARTFEEYVEALTELSDEAEIKDTNSSESQVNCDEPISMHYYEEMYYDQNYILDYTLKFEHDSLGRITTVENYDSNGVLVDTVEQEYDDDGNCTKKYSLATNIDALYLDFDYQYWQDGVLVKTERSDGMYIDEYDNNADGKPMIIYSYEDGVCYMEDNYTYDEQGRVSNIYRNNYGNWSFDIEYCYEGTEEKPYCIKFGDDEYYTYEYEYDDSHRLICEKNKLLCKRW